MATGTFQFTEAIVSRIPESPYLDQLVYNNHKNNDSMKMDSNKLREEFEEFTSVLREIGLDVIELPPDQSPFVGDVAFVLNGMGLVLRPKDYSTRKAEINTIRTILKQELDVPIVEMTDNDNDAYIEGSDILFTGRELFVGISDYTNEAGARFLANTFPEYPCSPIRVPEDKHLTNYVSMVAPDVICVGKGKDSQDVIKRMEREASFRYQTVTVPEDHAATVLYVNDSLVHLSSKEIPNSCKLFSEKLLMPRRTVDFSELSKLSANFSRLVVLLNNSKPKKGKSKKCL